jgi:hypothetical protein
MRPNGEILPNLVTLNDRADVTVVEFVGDEIKKFN